MSDPPPTIQLYTEPHSHGFSLTFNNGVTVSIRWGTMNYSDGCTSAECAAMFGHEFVHVPGFMYDGDDVLHRQTADQVAQFIETAARLSDPAEFINT